MLSELLLVVLSILIFFVLLGVLYLIVRSEKKAGGFEVISNNLESIGKNLQDLHREIGKIEEMGKDVKDFSIDFRTFFSGSTTRGPLGEKLLEDMLSQVLPKEHFSMPYSFRSGVRVDSIIKTDYGLIPIDSKFPLSNYKKTLETDNENDRESFKKAFINDVKKHITDIHDKYILTDEGTLDFALMYVPSESVFSEIHSVDELTNLAAEKHVMIVSPQTMYCYLQTILLSIEGRKIGEKALEISNELRALKKNSKNLEDQLKVLNRHIVDAHKKMDDVLGTHLELDKKLESIGSSENRD